MPYFVFKYHDSKFRSVDHIETFDAYKDAKVLVKGIRVKMSPENPDTYKIVFAEDILEAEILIMEKRDAPILREWEK